jgi:hypothetical protein
MDLYHRWQGHQFNPILQQCLTQTLQLTGNRTINHPITNFNDQSA